MNRTMASGSHRKVLGLKILLLVLFFCQAQFSRAALVDMVGRYVGAWTNITFGSTGKAVIIIGISGTNSTLTFDMDGFVFGYIDPPAITMPGTVVGNTMLIDNHGVGIFGDIKGSIDGTTGAFQTSLTNVPGGFITQVTNVGLITNGIINVNYTVDFPGAPSSTNPAHGVMVAVLTPPIVITNAVRAGTNLTLKWSGGKGPFAVQASSNNLSSGVWTNYSSPPTNSATVPISPSGTAFFRIAGQ
jgi:hypothetical protein